MAELCNVTLESGSLSEFDGYYEGRDGGVLSVSSAAALKGTYGLDCLIGDTRYNLWGRIDFNPVASGKLRYKAHFDTNGIAMIEAATVPFISLFTPLTDASEVGILKTGSDYLIYLTDYDDAGAVGSPTTTVITDAAHYVEVYIQQAATDSSSDGQVQGWVDGVLFAERTSIDNYDLVLATEDLYAGILGIGDGPGVYDGVTGTFYIDEIVLNDDGSEIGESTTVPIGAFSWDDGTVWG